MESLRAYTERMRKFYHEQGIDFINDDRYFVRVDGLIQGYIKIFKNDNLAAIFNETELTDKLFECLVHLFRIDETLYNNENPKEVTEI